MDNLVNDELAVGFDARFERRFVYLQWGGQLVLLAVVLLALFGFLGRGPFSHATAQIVLAEGPLRRVRPIDRRHTGGHLPGKEAFIRLDLKPTAVGD